MIRNGVLFTKKGLLRVDEIGSVFAPRNILLQKDVYLIPDDLVTDFEQLGVQDVVCLTTRDGLEITMTEETEILVETKDLPTFVLSKNVSIGDKIVITTDKCCETKEQTFCGADYGTERIGSLPLTDDLIALVANYCYSGIMFGSRVRFHTSEKDREKVMRALEVLRINNVSNVIDINREISFTSELFCRWLVNNKIQDVPLIIRTSPKSVIKKFLSGVEQTFPSIHSASSCFVQQTLALYRYVGYTMCFSGTFSARERNGEFDSDEVVSKVRLTDYTFFIHTGAEALFLSGAVIR